MADDLRRGLLGRKGGSFDKLYEDCLIRIQRVKQRNDAIQKQIGTDLEDHIKTQVSSQRKFIEKEINDLKDLMNQMDIKYRDPESKNKMKQVKAQAQKQIQRNKVILKQLINKSFASRSMARNDHDHPQEHHFMDGGRIDYQALEHNRIQQVEEGKQSLITDNGMMAEADYEFQRRLILEKNQIINEVEQSTTRINEIINDMAVMVDQQGEDLDIITDQLVKTNENLVHTNKNLDDASSLQKKSRKKYVLLVVIILLIVLVVAGLIFFLVVK